MFTNVSQQTDSHLNNRKWLWTILNTSYPWLKKQRLHLPLPYWLSVSHSLSGREWFVCKHLLTISQMVLKLKIILLATRVTLDFEGKCSPFSCFTKVAVFSGKHRQPRQSANNQSVCQKTFTNHSGNTNFSIGGRGYQVLTDQSLSNSHQSPATT